MTKREKLKRLLEKHPELKQGELVRRGYDKSTVYQVRKSLGLTRVNNRRQQQRTTSGGYKNNQVLNLELKVKELEDELRRAYATIARYAMGTML